MGEHPRIGQVILEQATSMREAVPIVLHHHERFDGSGYPHGLRGEEIPIGARIVAVADAYHAMVHERPYKSALSHAQALDELRRHRSTQFDPTVVEVFLAVFGEQVPSDGLEEIHRLHDHVRVGLEAADPATAALIGAMSLRDPDPSPPPDLPSPADEPSPRQRTRRKASGHAPTVGRPTPSTEGSKAAT